MLQARLDALNERKVRLVSSHDDETMVPRGRSNEAVVEKASTESTRAPVSARDQPGHDECSPCPRRVTWRNDAAKVLEWSDPVFVILPIASLVAGARQDFLRDRRVLKQKWSEAPLEGREGVAAFVRRDRLHVEVGVDHISLHLRLRLGSGLLHLAEYVVPGPPPGTHRPQRQALAERDQIQCAFDRLGFRLRSQDLPGHVQLRLV